MRGRVSVSGAKRQAAELPWQARDLVRQRIPGPTVQRKPVVGAVGTEHEREADRVADTVMRMPDVAGVRTGRSTTNDEPFGSSMRAAGAPLPTADRVFFDSRFGFDFSRVRIHSDREASDLVHALGAYALTIGNDIAFAPGRYQPQSFAGRRLLAHELTHVVQQTGASEVTQEGAPLVTPARAGDGTGALIQRKTPDEVRTDYQVSDDEVVDWSPRLVGLVPIPFTDSHKMTKTEGKLLDELASDRGLIGLSTFEDCKEKAFSESEKQYPAPSTFPGHAPTDTKERRAWVNNDGHRDAFRHCYWNALLTKNFGKKWAEEFATAHEAIPGNPAEREAMDLYNNEVGREIAAGNKRASEADLAELVKSAVDSGKLLVIDKTSKLAWSNAVAVWDHGTTGSASIGGKLGVPAGNASANPDS